jgi:predicted ester cyclase
MSVEANKRVIQRFTTECINTASETVAAELIAPDSVFHLPGMSVPLRGPAGYLQVVRTMCAGFSNLQWILEDMVAEGDKVAARFTLRGTHDGLFFGVPRLGRPLSA